MKPSSMLGEGPLASTADPRLVTAAEAARLLGVARQRILELVVAGRIVDGLTAASRSSTFPLG
jgi:plasmid maintenance system antidote protein VapI